MRHVIAVIRQQYIGVAALFLVLGGFAAAVSGQAILLGRPNFADKPTAVQNTGTGAVLELKAKAGQPPLKVNSNTLVPKLNADLLDGKHAAAFALVGAGYTKAQADARYFAAGVAYTKAESDAKYLAVDAAYTKTEGDARHGRVLYQGDWNGATPDGAEQSIYTYSIIAPGDGVVLVILTMDRGPSTNDVRVHVAGQLRGNMATTPTTVDNKIVASDVAGSEALLVELKLDNLSDIPGAASGSLLVVYYPSG